MKRNLACESCRFRRAKPTRHFACTRRQIRYDRYNLPGRVFSFFPTPPKCVAILPLVTTLPPRPRFSAERETFHATPDRYRDRRLPPDRTRVRGRSFAAG